MNIKRPLVFYFICFIFGCLNSLVFNYSVFIGAVLSASFLISLYLCNDKKYFFIMIVFFVCGMLNFEIYFNCNVNTNINKFRVLENKGYYAICENKNRNFILQGNIRELKNGEIAVIQGNFQSKIDYQRGIVGIIKVDKILNTKSDLVTKTYKFKELLYNRFREKLNEQDSAMVMALCFGNVDHLSYSQKDMFSKLGVIHAISVSGFHMSIIYGILECLFSLKIALIISLLYLIFTGASAATARAFIMIFILKISRKVYKKYDSLSSISLAGLILLLYKPYYILDVGYGLSFLATLGIVLYYNKIRKKLYKLPEKINSTISITMSAQIFTYPYLGFTIGNFSNVFLIANMLLLPLYTIIVILGNLAMIFYLVKPIMVLFLSMTKIFMNGINFTQDILLKISGNLKYITYVEGIAVLCLYGCYILYKHGFKRSIYFPIALTVIMLFQNYYFIPEIDYFRTNNGNIFLLRNKYKSIAFVDYNINCYNEVLELKNYYNVNKIILTYDEKIRANICNKYIFYMPRINDDGDSIKLISKSKYIIFNRNNEVDIAVNSDKYDIINLPEKEESFGYTRLNSLFTIKLFLGNMYKF